MELLWPDLDPEAALNNLHLALHVNRRTLEPSAPASNAASRYLHLRDERLTLYPEGLLWVEGKPSRKRRLRHGKLFWSPRPTGRRWMCMGESFCRRIATSPGWRGGGRS